MFIQIVLRIVEKSLSREVDPVNYECVECSNAALGTVRYSSTGEMRKNRAAAADRAP